MQKLIDGLRHFQANLHWKRQELFERSISGQNPQALLITCSDSRVLLDQLMQADPGDLFVHRNAGNLIPAPDKPSGEAATIEYAVNTLAVTDIIVCGHYRCGAVKALLDAGVTLSPTPLRSWLDHAAETLTVIEKHHSHLVGEERWDKAVEQNVLVQLATLSKHPAVVTGLATGQLRLHAWVLRFESSEVFAYEPAKGKFQPLLDMSNIHPTLPVAEPINEKPDVPRSFPKHELSSDRDRDIPAWHNILKSDLPASLVVFAVALPLCVAVAKASGVPTAAGILTAIIGGIVVGLLGGGPVQVSGPTAGLIVVLLGIQEKLGLPSLGLVVLLAGLMQIAAGALRVGQWFRAVSPAVILGMLAGIGSILFAQQFHLALDDEPARSPLANLFGMPRAIVDIFDGHPGHPGNLPAALVGFLTLAILLLWKRLVPKKLKAIPSVLAAVVVATATASFLDLPIQKVEFHSLVKGVSWIDPLTWSAKLMDSAIWQFAFIVAFLGSAESLLTAAAIDGMHSGARTRYDRELAAQGVGNVLCGLIGALPMAGVIVRTSANLEAGAKSRWATIFHGIWMCAFVLLMPGLLRLIPVAALAAILVLTGFRLLQLPAIKRLWNESRSEAVICIAVAISVVAVNLLSGVLIGVGLSLAKLIYTFSRLRVIRRDGEATGQTTLILEGSATFLRLPKLAQALEVIPRGTVLQVDFKGLSYIDHACLALLMNWESQHVANGGVVKLDWEALKARFHRANPRPRCSSDNRNRISHLADCSCDHRRAA